MIENLNERLEGAVPHVKGLLDNGYQITLYTMDVLSQVAMSVPTVLFTGRAMAIAMEVGMFTAVLSAIGVEIAGQVIVNRYIHSLSWNKTRNKTDERAMSGLLFWCMVAYFSVDMLTIGLMELPKVLTGDFVHIVGLTFPIMQIVTVISSGERLAQIDRELNKAEQKAERRKRKGERVRKPTKQDERVHDTVEQDKYVQIMLNTFTEQPKMTYRAMAEIVGRSPAWISGKVKDLEAQGVIHKNGEGIEVL